MSTTPTSFSFTSGGIDVSSIVSQLMTAERMPLQLIQARQLNVTTQQKALASVKSGLDGLSGLAADIVANGLTKLTTSSSNTSVATAAIGSGAIAGTVNFTVDRLAAAHGLRTSTVPAATSAITSSGTLAISGNASAHGITGISADSSVPLGKYTVTVTQATAGASITGTTALAATTTIDNASNQLTLTIDGVDKTVTIANGTYDAQGLATAVQNGIDAAGGGAVATLDATNHLTITTTHEGSAATLALSNGTALTKLGLPVTFPAKVGIDGILRVGTNPPVMVLSAGMAEEVAVSTGTGNLTMKLGSGLRVGDSTVAVVSTGDRSLSSVANAINLANVGVSASAVQAGSNSWLLQLTANSTGTAHAISTDAAAFAPAGGLIQTSAAVDAKITIGSGVGAYSIVGSGNTFANVMQGVNITATSLSATPVTVSVGRDDAATADKIDKLVTQANDLIKTLTTNTKYDAATNTVAPLANDATVRGLAAQVRAAVTGVVGGSSTGLAGTIGIDVQQDGTLKFDKAKFLSAIATDPTGVETLFNRHGSGANGLTFVSASDNTIGGSYAVNVTTAATRATSGEQLVGGSVAGQTINVRIGTTVASYQAAAGATAAEIVSGLNDSLAKSGMKVAAEVTVGGGVKLTSTAFGVGGSFDVNYDATGAGAYQSYAGTDVAGTINGKVASGVGNRLTLFDLGTDPARGIKIDVGEGLTGAIGTVDYQPGIAARLVTIDKSLTAAFGGLTTAATTFDRQIKDYNTQIDAFNARMVIKEANLRSQWTRVQTALTALTNQQGWLQSQISSMTKGSSSG